MDESVYRRVLLAVSTVNAGASTPEERQMATAFLEAFKQEESACQYAFYILNTQSPEHTDTVRYFALHCVEKSVEWHWKDWPLERRLALRQGVCQLVVGGTRPLMEERSFIKEKLANLLADLVERDFPQRWTTLVDDLLAAAAMGPTQSELALRTLTCVAEDCTSADYNAKVSTSRRNDVLRGLNALMDDQILPWLYGLMSDAHGSRYGGFAVLLSQGLRMLAQLVQWVPREKLGAQGRDFVDVCLHLLQLAECRTEALRMLLELCSCALPEKMTLQLLHGLPMAVQGVLGGKPLAELLGDGDAESLGLCSDIARCVSDLYVTNSDAIVKADAAALSTFFSLGVYLLSSPSLRVASALLPMFSAAFRDDAMKGCGTLLRGIVSETLGQTCQRCCRTWLGDEPLTPIAEGEYSDGDEAAAAVHVFRSQANALFESVGQSFPEESLLFAAECLTTLVAEHHSADAALSLRAAARGQEVKDGENFALSSCPDFLVWDAYLGRMEHLLCGVPPSHLRSDCAALQDAFARLLAFAPADPSFAKSRVDAIASVRRWLGSGSRNALLLDAVGDIFGHVVYGAPNGPGAHLPAPQGRDLVDLSGRGRDRINGRALDVRKRADAALISVCGDCAACLVEALPAVAARAQELLHGEWLVDTQSTHLLEVCCLLARAVPSADERAAFVLRLLEPTISFWASDATRDALRSASDLWQQMGLGASDAALEDPAFVADRSVWYNRLFTALNDVLAVGRRVAVADVSQRVVDAFLHSESVSDRELLEMHPMTPAWRSIVPPICQLLRCVHDAWHPDNRDRLLAHPSARMLLAMPAPEAMLKASATNVLSVVRPKSASGLAPGAYQLPGQPKAKEAADAPEAKAPAGVRAGDAEAPAHTLYGQNSFEALAGRRLPNLWPIWMSEMRNAVYQILGRAIEAQQLFRDAPLFQDAVDAVLHNLDFQENRHINFVVRHVLEPLVLSCPPALHATHLAPVLERVAPHMLRRVTAAWGAPCAPPAALAGGADALYASQVLVCAARLDGDSAELLADKIRRELTRNWLDFLHVAFGLRGALLVVVRKSKKGGGGFALNGKAKAAMKRAAEKTEHANLLKRLFLFGPPRCTEALVLFCLGAMAWPDSTSLRRAVNVLQVVVEATMGDNRFNVLLGRDVFRACVSLLLQEPDYIAGVEWEVLALLRDIYVALVVGRSPSEAAKSPAEGEESKWVMRTDLPRQTLLGLGGADPQLVQKMEGTLRASLSAKAQKDAIRAVLRGVMPRGAANEDRAGILRRGKLPNIESLPEKLVLRSKRLSNAAIEDTGTLFDGLDG